MQIGIKTTIGSEVRWLGVKSSASTCYGEVEVTAGEWKIDLIKIEAYLCEYLQGQAFGGAVEKFVFGFEIANVKEWGNFFTALENYVSYRLKPKTLISVCQIEWDEVKLLTASEQYVVLKNGFVNAVNRVGSMKRKPKGFSFQNLCVSVSEALSNVPAGTFELK